MLGFWETFAFRKQLSHGLGIIKRHVATFSIWDWTVPLEVMDCLALYCCTPFSKRAITPKCIHLVTPTSSHKELVCPPSAPFIWVIKFIPPRGNLSGLIKRRRQNMRLFCVQVLIVRTLFHKAEYRRWSRSSRRFLFLKLHLYLLPLCYLFGRAASWLQHSEASICTVACGIFRCGARNIWSLCGIFSCGMLTLRGSLRDLLPGPGIKPRPRPPCTGRAGS